MSGDDSTSVDSNEYSSMLDSYYLTSSAEVVFDLENDTALNGTDQKMNWTVDDLNRWHDYGPACQLQLTTRHIILIVCFTIIFTLSVIGNCLVIVTIAQNRWMRTVTNIFLQSLAISDLLLSVICMPPTLTAMLFQCFLWGQAMCKLIMYLQPVSVAASAYTLVAIALERYNAICRPLHSRHWKTKSHAVKMIVTVWVVSLLCSSPSLFMYNLVEIRPGQWNCRDDSGGGAISAFYTLFLFLVLFVVPLVLMVVLYAAVTYTLWMGIKLDSTTSNGEMSSPTDEHSSIRSSAASMRQRLSASKPAKAISRISASIRNRSAACGSIVLVNRSRQPPNPPDQEHKSPARQSGNAASGHKSSASAGPDWKLLGAGAPGPVLRCTHSAKNLEAKKRVIIMLFVIVAEFLLCWSPLYAYLALWQFKYITHFDAYLYTFLVVLAYLSSCSNPITYCFLNLKFRQAFLLAFGCRFLVKEAPLLYQNTMGAARRNQNIQNVTARRGAGGPGSTVGSKQDLAIHDHDNHDRAVEGTMIQFHDPEKPSSIQLLQVRTPSFRPSPSEASGSKPFSEHVYETDEDDDDMLVNTPPRASNFEPSTPISNGNRDHSSRNTPNGARAIGSPSVQEKLTSV